MVVVLAHVVQVVVLAARADALQRSAAQDKEIGREVSGSSCMQGRAAVLAARADALRSGALPGSSGGSSSGGGSAPTFWLLAARLSLAKSELGSTVPRKMGLNWFMPALLRSRRRGCGGGRAA